MGKRAGLDVTVVNTMSASYVCTPAANDAKHALKAAVETKEKRHRDACEAAGYDYYTAGWTVFGAVFGGFFDSLVKPHYKHAKAMAKRNGEDPWQVQSSASAPGPRHGQMVRGHRAPQREGHP
jgi:hypothetical protein